MRGRVFGKKNKGADYPPFSSASIPSLLPSHTGLGTNMWSEMKLWGGGGEGSFVSSAYWKRTVGCFPV